MWPVEPDFHQAKYSALNDLFQLPDSLAKRRRRSEVETYSIFERNRVREQKIFARGIFRLVECKNISPLQCGSMVLA